MKDIFVTSTLISRKEFSEIDMENKENFGFDYDNENDFILIEKIKDGVKNYSLDVEPIEIDKLIKHLNKIKEEGANYVGIHYHEDHIGYVIGGYSVSLSTEEEISEYNEIETQRNKKLKAIDILSEELRKLKAGI